MAQAAGQMTKRVRTCIACGEQDDKRSLLRIVRTAEGGAAFDATGRQPGRGAYVCSASCFEAARKGKRLNRALKMQVTEEDYAQIAAELERYGDSVQG